MAADPVVAAVLDRLVQPLRADGTTAELLNVVGGVATVRYRIGHNDDCETCVMPPEDFREFFLAALERTAPSVTDVVVVSD
jgi:hypothetical protein